MSTTYTHDHQFAAGEVGCIVCLYAHREDCDCERCQPEAAARLRLGLTAGVPEADYHRGGVDGEPSLSAAGMKTLLSKSPAHYQHEQDHPEDQQKGFFDCAVRAYLLGGTESVAEMREGPATETHSFGSGDPYDDYRTEDARQKRDEASRWGLVPLLGKDLARVQAMAATLGTVGLPGSGIPIVTAVARDPESGVLLRARFDWLADSRDCAIDYATAPSLDVLTGQEVQDYYLQAATYQHVAALVGVALTEVKFIVQETVPPYALRVARCRSEAMLTGRQRMREAIELYADCAQNGSWPGLVSVLTL